MHLPGCGDLKPPQAPPATTSFKDKDKERDGRAGSVNGSVAGSGGSDGGMMGGNPLVVELLENTLWNRWGCVDHKGGNPVDLILSLSRE